MGDQHNVTNENSTGTTPYITHSSLTWGDYMGGDSSQVWSHDSKTVFSPNKGRGVQNDPDPLFQTFIITTDLMTHVKYDFYPHTWPQRPIYGTSCGKRQTCDRGSERLVCWRIKILPRTQIPTQPSVCYFWINIMPYSMLYSTALQQVLKTSSY